jgi:hypothetical protein
MKGVQMSSARLFRNITAFGLTLLLVSAGAAANAKVIVAKASTVKLTASANGANVTGGKGVATGSASAVFTINTSKETICYNLKEQGLVGVNYSHIHKGATGIDGAVVVDLNAKKFNVVGNTCTTVGKAILGDIALNPSQYYFNVHTAAFPNGAVRGQLSNGKKPKPAATSTTSPKPSSSATPKATKSSKY